MSAYSPTLPRTAELHGLDRLLVRAGTHLTAWGRRRADARARALLAAARRASTDRTRTAVESAYVERRHDNAAQLHPLQLR